MRRWVALSCLAVSAVIHGLIALMLVFCVDVHLPSPLSDRFLCTMELYSAAPVAKKASHQLEQQASPPLQEHVIAKVERSVAPIPKAPAPVKQAVKAKSRPAPSPSVARAKAVVHAQSPPASVSPARRISPRISGKKPESKDLPGVYKDTSGVIHVGGMCGMAGFADTFSLDMCGADVFTDEEYWGHYDMGKGRVVSILSGAKGSGDFLFYDSKTRLYRKLKRRSRMIFLYGPSSSKFEPVQGVLTILPKKDRYHNELIRNPAQLMWMVEGHPMRYGTRLFTKSTSSTLDVHGVSLFIESLVCPKRSPKATILFVDSLHAGRSAFGKALASLLAIRGIQLVRYDPRCCGKSSYCSGQITLEQLQRDFQAVYASLPSSSPCGVWLHGSASSLFSPSFSTDFLICSGCSALPAHPVDCPAKLFRAPAGIPPALTLSQCAYDWLEKVF